jgi:hypothetical protein
LPDYCDIARAWRSGERKEFSPFSISYYPNYLKGGKEERKGEREGGRKLYAGYFHTQ